MNSPEPSTMARSHVLVHRLHSIAAGHLAVLLVHVVRAGARIVADPDTEVLHLLRTLLMDLNLHQHPNPTPLHIDTVHTLFKLTISPLAFLTFLSLARKYQKRDLATTSLGAKIRMR